MAEAASVKTDSLNASLTSNAAHPFYPIEVEIVAYLANEMTMQALLSIFVAGCVALLLGTRYIVDRSHPMLPTKEKLAVLWFVLSGTIHFFFEGYFSVNHKAMAPAQDLFGQLWKEYALSDSRYLTSEPFVVCMETVTAFTWGPLCGVIAYMITTSHPLRHPIQIIVCVGQMYGLILYYATAMFDHYYNAAPYSRPEFLYFWVYFFAVNFIWFIVPGLLLFDSIRSIARTTAAFDKMGKTLANGKAVGSKKSI